MATKIPFEFEGTLVGRTQGGTFKREGQEIAYSGKLQFLVRAADGSVDIFEVGEAALDKCSPPVDHTTFTTGDLVRLGGVAVIQDRGSDRDSYVAVRSAALAGAVAAPLKDAAKAS